MILSADIFSGNFVKILDIYLWWFIFIYFGVGGKTMWGFFHGNIGYFLVILFFCNIRMHEANIFRENRFKIILIQIINWPGLKRTKDSRVLKRRKVITRCGRHWCASWKNWQIQFLIQLDMWPAFYYNKVSTIHRVYWTLYSTILTICYSH